MAAAPPPLMHADASTAAPSSSTESAARSLVYSCRVCRALLARSTDLAPAHEPATHGFSPHRAAKDARPGASGGVGGGIFSGGGGGGGNSVGGYAGAGTNPACTSLFLAEPAPWMAAVAGDVEGKLTCPGVRSGARCGARLGTLRWAGGQCSCGSWVTPAIQLFKKSLDERDA